jgi:hypothetical protein
MIDRAALGQFFFQYFSSPAIHSFHQLLHDHHHLSCRAGTVRQYISAVIVDSVPIQPHTKEIINK